MHGPKTALPPPSAEAARHLKALPIDFASGQKLAANRSGAFTEYFKLDANKKLRDTQYSLAGRHSLARGEPRPGGGGAGPGPAPNMIEERPQYVKVAGGTPSLSPGARGPRLGIMPSYSEEGEGVPQIVGCLLVVALAQVDHAEIGQSVSLAEAMAGLAVEDEGLPVDLGSLPVAALPPADEAEITQRVGFADAGACFAVAGERLLVAFGGLLVAALPPVDEAEVGERAGFADTVTGFAEEGEGLLVVLGGLLVTALPHVNHANIGQGVGFGGAVIRLAGGVPGVGVDAQRVGEVSAGIEVTEQGSGQPDGVSGPAVGGGVRADGDQVRSFGI